MVEAVKAAGRADKVAVFGTDAVSDAYTAIRSGDLTGTVDSFPVLTGEIAKDAALRLMEGQKLPHGVATPQALITKDNVETYATTDMAALGAAPTPASSCSTSRPAAWTWAPRLKSTIRPRNSPGQAKPSPCGVVRTARGNPRAQPRAGDARGPYRRRPWPRWDHRGQHRPPRHSRILIRRNPCHPS